MKKDLLKTGLAVAATAVIGGLATDPDSTWYRDLRKPSWQPPRQAFALIWTPLYASIAYATARALSRSEGPARQALTRTLAVNLTLNAAWSAVFFRARSPRLALAEILTLNASNAALIVRTARTDREAGLTLLPYAGWTLFATALNASIANCNRPGASASNR
jgi:translocator protein